MPQTDESVRAAAQDFFDAIERGDIEAMKSAFTPGAEIWHNTDELVVSVAHTARILQAMVERIHRPRYADRRVAVFPGGFVQQHVLEGVRASDGVAVRLPCCIVCQVEGGKITRLEEYFDSAHAATFR